MKTYVITLSKFFQKSHPRSGEATEFHSKFLNGNKKHTIRENYDFWKKRFDKIDKGEAQLSIRGWTGLPYRSKQFVIANLTKEHGIGITRARKCSMTSNISIEPLISHVDASKVAKNDGLELQDFSHWFDHIEPMKDLALIYLGEWRY